jgi:hypothetical protein
MNDLDRELRDLLDEDGRRAPSALVMPDGMERRVRLRQVRTAALASGAFLVAVVGVIVILQAIVPHADRSPGSEGPMPTASPTAPAHPRAIAKAQQDLRNALVAALTMYTDGETFVGFTPEVAASIEPSLTYNAAPSARVDEISIRDATRSTIVLATMIVDGDVFCIAEDEATGTTSYGVMDAQTAADCDGGEAAWSIEPTGSSTPSASPSIGLVQGHGVAVFDAFDASWTLSADAGDQGVCLYLTRTDGTALGACDVHLVDFAGWEPTPFASHYGGNGLTYSFIVGLAPEGTESAVIMTADRQGFSSLLVQLPPIVGTEGTAFVFNMDLEGGKGTLTFYDASLNEIASGPVSWSSAT